MLSPEPPAAAAAAVRLNDYAVAPAVPQQVPTLEERRELQLYHVRRATQLAQLAQREVADADGAHPTRALQRTHGSPRHLPSLGMPSAPWLLLGRAANAAVHQQQVDVVRAQSRERSLKRAHRRLVARAADLGRQEEGLARQATARHRTADARLALSILWRRVDQPISQRNRRGHRILCRVVEDAATKPDDRHVRTAAQARGRGLGGRHDEGTRRRWRLGHTCVSAVLAVRLFVFSSNLITRLRSLRGDFGARHAAGTGPEAAAPGALSGRKP